MRERLTNGWNLTRVIYVLIGAALAYQSAAEKQWFGIFIGGYFAAMGLFAFGCAGGNCYPISRHKGNETVGDITYEEVK